MSSAIIVQQPQTVADTRERDRLTRNLIIKNASPDHIALALGICDRYGFDPLLKHIAIISGNIYVTRDGLIHLAHASGQFDGIEVVRREQSDRGKWRVTVAVHRRDMRHPFVYTAIQEEHEGATGPWQKSPHAMTQKCADVVTRRSEDRFGRAYNALTGPERVELLAAIRATPQPELDSEDVIDALFEDRAAVGAA